MTGRRWIILVLGGVALLLAVRTHLYVRAWHSELTLWGHAVQMAPYKPRPWLNYGTALLLAGRRSEAIAAWERSIRVAALPHVPPWDRQAARQLAGQNLRMLAILEGQ